MTGRTDDDPRDLIFEEGDDEDRKEYGISEIIFEEEYDDDTMELLHEQSIIGMAAGGYDCFDYMDDDWIIREQRRCNEEERGIRRQKNGRLKKGSQLAKKYKNKEQDIYLRYAAGMTPAQIVETTGYSKSSVYDVIKKYRN